MMKKMMKLWMHLILFAASISAYAKAVDCDVEEDSCSWSIEGFKMISDNQLSSTDGRNDIMDRNDCNFLDRLCSWEGKDSNFPANVNNVVTEFISTSQQSVLISGFDIYPGEKCLSFRYQMKDFKRECMSIEVYSLIGNYWSLVWMSQSQHQIHGWNEINVTINVEYKSNIGIKFLHGNCFKVTYFISSISLKTQSCTANTVNTAYAKDGVKIGIVISGIAFSVAVLLIATYLYRRRATSSSANISKHSTVSSVTCSGATRPNTDNGKTSHSTERLNQTSETVPHNAQAEYSTDLKTQPRQSKTKHRFLKGTLNIYPCQIKLLNDENSVTNPEQTNNQYHPSADKGGTNSYDAMDNTNNHTTEFRDDTYDCTTIHHTTIPDPTYDHSSFKQNIDNIYNHSKSGTLNLDMGYLDHSCDAALQQSMQYVDPTYDHI